MSLHLTPTSAAAEGVAPTGSIALQGVSLHFGSGKTAVQALADIDLDIRPGEFVSILGPSGCGKSTFIGAIAGFTKISAGSLHVDGAPVKAPGPDRGVVFQQHTLFPWKNVVKNVEFSLKMRGVGPRERRASARGILGQVGLQDFLRHYPAQLSGGMQQRVNLARALVTRPRVLLMDEPFSALDAQTRLRMQELLLDLWKELRMTVIFVTHDVDEALFLSDRVIVLSPRPGRVQATLDVGLPRPRGPETLTDPAFSRLKRECLDLLFGGEARRAPAREPASALAA